MNIKHELMNHVPLYVQQNCIKYIDTTCSINYINIPELIRLFVGETIVFQQITISM